MLYDVSITVYTKTSVYKNNAGKNIIQYSIHFTIEKKMMLHMLHINN